jgi:hypothetical protein
VVSHQEVVHDAAEFGLLRMVRALAVLFPSAALIQVLANLNDYRQPAVAVVVWLAMFPAAAWLVPRMRGDGLSGAEATAAVLIAVAVVAATGWEHRAHYAAGSVDLAILGTAWLLAMIALSRTALTWVPSGLAVFAVHAVLLIRAEGASPLSLAQLEAAGYVLVIALSAFAVLRPTLAMHASIVARRASLASRSAAERAAAAAIQQDRRNRLALLEMEALPLLRGIADGTLDPGADEVRQECARHAAVLRHSLADLALSPDAAVAWLEPALQAASARGLLVNVQVIGDPGDPPPEVAHAVLAALDAVMRVLPPHQVMLTVLAPGDDVELYLTFSTFSTFGEPSRAAPDVARFGADVPAAACWHVAAYVEETGAGCLEIGWRKAVRLDRRD